MAKSPIVTFAASVQLKAEIDWAAAAQSVSSSELIRGYIEKGLVPDKTAADIDFIRKQIRAELDLALEPKIERLIKLFVKVGMLTVSFCYFTSRIAHMFVPWDEQISYDGREPRLAIEPASNLKKRPGNRGGVSCAAKNDLSYIVHNEEIFGSAAIAAPRLQVLPELTELRLYRRL